MVKLILILGMGFTCIEPRALAQDASDTGPSRATSAQIKQDLEAARQVYRAKLEVARKPILERFEEMEDQARNDSKVERVEQIQKEREQFIQKGIVAGKLAKDDARKMATYKSQSDQARAELIRAYDLAIKGYLLAHEDSAAKETKAARDELVRNVPLKPKPLVLSPDFSNKPSRTRLGEWRFEGNELVPWKDGWNRVMFGEPHWTHYDVQFQVKVGQEKPHGFFIMFHANDNLSFQQFCMAVDGNRHFRSERKLAGSEVVSVERFDQSITLDRWHEVSVEVRGANVRILLDGKVVAKTTDERFVQGQVGLTTIYSLARFRNVRIVTPDGALLWWGSPTPY